MNRIAQLAYNLAQPIAEEQGIEIWDAEYVKEAGAWFLRIYIDKEGGVSIEHCEAFSRAMEAVLDERDPIEGAYVFEVSSAGAERELKRPSDFEKFIGHPVEVKLYQNQNGSKSFVGNLVSRSDEKIVITSDAGEMSFAASDVAQVKLRVLL